MTAVWKAGTMRIDELPTPPPGRTGWPWTDVPDLSPLSNPPRISIVTPVLNGERWLEQTIRSVLLQGLVDLEYLILDGGSSDATMTIVERYEPFLTFTWSGADRGQSAALNDGFARATGAVYGWLNADDYYLPGALNALLTLRSENPESVGWVGVTERLVVEGPAMPDAIPVVGGVREIADWGISAFIPQPSCLFDSATFHAVGGLDERLQLTMDWDLWLRMASLGTFAKTETAITRYRIHPGAKSQRGRDPLFALHPDSRLPDLVERVAVLFEQGLGDVAEMVLARRLELERAHSAD